MRVAAPDSRPKTGSPAIPPARPAVIFRNSFLFMADPPRRRERIIQTGAGVVNE
jgi:hypothetical protein